MADVRRVAWVTGGGRGIGRACALALARDGFDIGLTARSEAELTTVAMEVEALGRRAIVANANVEKAKSLARAHERIVRSLGPVEVLVTSAGVAKSAAFLKTEETLWESHWRLNVMGTVHAVSAALPSMLERKAGRVIAIASVAGKIGAPYIAAYAASKHAVLGVIRSLAAEYASSGVTFNAVCPGYVDTKMTQDNVDVIVAKTKMPREKAEERIRHMNPQGRLLSPDEVAALVAHLSHRDSQGINGQAITIDGGAVQV